MNITILTGCYYPQIHPRAFRATELAKEFVRQGHQVEVINMTTIEGFDYNAYVKDTHINIVNLDINKDSLESRIQKQSKLSQSFIGHKLDYLKEYFLHGRFFIHAKMIVPRLSGINNSDMVIALSTPFVCLYALSKHVEKCGKSFVAIADSGDPFYYSKQVKRAFYFKNIEKRVYKAFDYLTIPTGNAIPLYSKLLPVEKIKIIPQGFNMRDLHLYKGEFEEPVKFAYAGVFYWDIRNPEFLFKYLNECNMDFRFYIFMRYRDALVDSLLERYSNLKEKVILKYSLPHDELLYELSKMNFLVNIENISNTQMPSKLIDYGMSGRPIFSCQKDSFSEQKLNHFLNGDYSGSYEVDIEEYNIERIVENIIKLTKQN